MLIIERQLKVKVVLSSTKTQLIENQGWVVNLEKRIIDSKDNGLVAVLRFWSSLSVESNLKELS